MFIMLLDPHNLWMWTLIDVNFTSEKTKAHKIEVTFTLDC